MDNWDTLVSNVYCIYDSLAASICKITYSAGQKQWTPECAIIFEEGNNTNSCIRVDIISLPGKFQRILVIRPFRTSQDLIFQAKLQRKPIKMEIHKRNNIVLPIFNGKEPLVQQSKHRNFYNIVCVLSLSIYIENNWRNKQKPSHYSRDAGIYMLRTCLESWIWRALNRSYLANILEHLN